MNYKTKIIYSLIFISLIIGCNLKEKKLADIHTNSPLVFESISVGDSIKLYAMIKNTEKKTIEIDYVQIECGCLSGFKYNFSSIDPGNTDSIMFIYKPSSGGYVEQNIFIYFKGFKNPNHLLVKGIVKDQVN